MEPTPMSAEEIVNAAQGLTFEERKKLIQALFTQMPKPSALAGSVEYVGDWEAGKASIRMMTAESLARTATEVSEASEATT